MKNGIQTQNIGTRNIQEHELPHCLTRQYQDRVAQINQTIDPNRGINKRTGIWDETHRCSD